jgi:hypothetical protein
MLPWDIEMTVEEPLSDDEDGVPHDVSDSESESGPNRPVPKSACRTQRPSLLPICCRDAVNRSVIFLIIYVLVLNI